MIKADANTKTTPISQRKNVTTEVSVPTYLFTASTSGNIKARRITAIPSLKRSMLNGGSKETAYFALNKPDLRQGL